MPHHPDCPPSHARPLTNARFALVALAWAPLAFGIACSSAESSDAMPPTILCGAGTVLVGNQCVVAEAGDAHLASDEGPPEDGPDEPEVDGEPPDVPDAPLEVEADTPEDAPLDSGEVDGGDIPDGSPPEAEAGPCGPIVTGVTPSHAPRHVSTHFAVTGSCLPVTLTPVLTD